MFVHRIVDSGTSFKGGRERNPAPGYRSGDGVKRSNNQKYNSKPAIERGSCVIESARVLSSRDAGRKAPLCNIDAAPGARD